MKRTAVATANLVFCSLRGITGRRTVSPTHGPGESDDAAPRTHAMSRFVVATLPAIILRTPQRTQQMVRYLSPSCCMYVALSQNNCSSAMQPFCHRASVTAVIFSLLPVGGITLPPMGQGFVNVPSITMVVAVQRPLFNRAADVRASGVVDTHSEARKLMGCAETRRSGVPTNMAAMSLWCCLTPSVS